MHYDLASVTLYAASVLSLLALVTVCVGMSLPYECTTNYRPHSLCAISLGILIA